MRLAQTADRLGYTRYWLAEHHNMPAVAATSPPVLIAYLAAQTTQLRLGSGGVMLPNHAPLAVAEQFALLEAAAPGRIDLGLGRAPGRDPVTSILLRGGRDGRDDQRHRELPAVPRRGGGADERTRGAHPASATRTTSSRPRRQRPASRGSGCSGSSMYSAHLAAAKGLPYVFAHHFSGQGTAEALEVYRSEFRPSTWRPNR